MNLIAAVVSVLVVVGAFVHMAIAVYFRTKLVLQTFESNAEHQNGLASVILAIRGCDPGLKQTLLALLDQDYENYDIHLVVDHRRDAAWNLVHEVKEQFDEDHRISIHEMTKPMKTCGLKCSSLLQGLEQLHPNTKFLVLIDADVIPHENWLSHLIAPLADKKIGVVTGNQWFEPKTLSAGSILRSLWNAGALVPTAIYSNPWAGSFAMRMKDVRRARLAKIWRRSIVDDGPIRRALQPLGLSIYFAPNLIMVNRERCTLSYVFRYVRRMLTWSRMYESTFLNTVIHAGLTVGLVLSAFAALITSIVLGNWEAATTVGIGILVAGLVNGCAYFAVRNAVSLNAGLRGEELGKVSLLRTFLVLTLAPVAYLVYGFSCLQACLCQHIQWRQITYQLHGRSQVKMVRYQPWVPSEADQVQSEVSI